MPNVGDRVMYVLPSQRFVPATVVRVLDADSVNLVVFADPADGQEFATGTAVKQRVSRWQRKQEGEYPTSNTWFMSVN